MRQHLFLAVFTAALFGAGCSQASSHSPNSSSDEASAVSGKLYLRTMMWGSSLDISFIYLGSDGAIIKNPKHGVNPVDVKAETADNASNTGRYTLSGDQMKITWADGKAATWKVERKNGELSAIDGGIVTLQKPMAAGFRLSGSYSAGAVLSGVSSSNTLTFSKDGSFRSSSLGAVSTPQAGAAASSKSSGTYNITGNTLRLRFSDGSEQVAVITSFKNYDGKMHLVINRSSYPQVD